MTCSYCMKKQVSSARIPPRPTPPTATDRLHATLKFPLADIAWGVAAKAILAGADLASRTNLSIADSNDNVGHRALRFAASAGAIEVMELLLDRAVPINGHDRAGTPLTHAARNGRYDAVLSLLARGADPNRPDAGGRTALMYAADADHPTIVAMLIDHGARIEQTNRVGWTALAYAAINNAARAAEELLARSADPNACDDRGASILTRMARIERITAALPALIRYGADPLLGGQGKGHHALRTAIRNRNGSFLAALDTALSTLPTRAAEILCALPPSTASRLLPRTWAAQTSRRASIEWRRTP